jgi:hypothetical protein
MNVNAPNINKIIPDKNNVPFSLISALSDLCDSQKKRIPVITNKIRTKMERIAKNGPSFGVRGLLNIPSKVELVTSTIKKIISMINQ